MLCFLAPLYVRACRDVTEHEAGGRARGARDPLLALEAYKGQGQSWWATRLKKKKKKQNVSTFYSQKSEFYMF